jgi:Cu+-exporting ATPase
MRITPANANRAATVLYTSFSVAAALAFLAATLPGDYDAVARVGGALWVFLLVMIILMPTLPPLLRERAARTGDPRVGPSLIEERSKQMTKDPVCGMDVDPESAAGSSEHEGQVYYFCSLACQQSFDADPEKYVVSASDPT